MAQTLSVDMANITVRATSTDSTANASATGGSVTSELCCAAAQSAAQKVAAMMSPVWASLGGYTGAPFTPVVTVKNVPFEAAAAACTGMGMDLSARGTVCPGPSPVGQLFQYMSWGAACVEAQLDVLTGEVNILRSDVLLDCGKTLNPIVDIGQMEVHTALCVLEYHQCVVHTACVGGYGSLPRVLC